MAIDDLLMFPGAWRRELASAGIREWKAHLIDELVLGTQQLVAERNATREERDALRERICVLEDLLRAVGVPPVSEPTLGSLHAHKGIL